MKHTVIKGTKYGELTVIKEVIKARRLNNKRTIHVSCSCGTTKYVALSNLIAGNTVSCGCLKINRNKIEVQVGDVFSKLKVIREIQNTEVKRRSFELICDCGNKIITTLQNLRRGDTKSCGCLHKERASETNTTHGLSRHPLYKIWIGIKRRCYDKNEDNYKYYGGRGLRMCKTWFHNPEIFIDWALKHGWKQGLEIDRENNNKGYKPSNCRFVTHQINANNTRSNHMVYINCENLTFINAVRKYGKVSYSVANRRCNKLNWDAVEAITTPL